MLANGFVAFNYKKNARLYPLDTKVRSKLGTKLRWDIFQELKKQLKDQGYMHEEFTFLDATH